MWTFLLVPLGGAIGYGIGKVAGRSQAADALFRAGRRDCQHIVDKIGAITPAGSAARQAEYQRRGAALMRQTGVSGARKGRRR